MIFPISQLIQMTQVVGIEFCSTFFKDEKECLNWLKGNKWEDLCRVKGFKLRRNGQAKILTQERKRSVFQWTQGYGTFPRLDVTRYAEPVVIVTGSGNRFAPIDYPSPLPSTVEHEKKKADRHAARLEKMRAEKAAKILAEGPKEPKKRKKKTDGEPKKKQKNAPTAIPVYGIQLG